MNQIKYLYSWVLLTFVLLSCANKKETPFVFEQLKVQVCHLSQTYSIAENQQKMINFSFKRSEIMKHNFNFSLSFNGTPNIKDAFVDIHKMSETFTHGVGGHQDGEVHNMPDQFQGRMGLNKENENGYFSLEAGNLVLKNRFFPLQSDPDFGLKAIGKYKVVVGMTNERNIYNEFIYILEILD